MASHQQPCQQVGVSVARDGCSGIYLNHHYLTSIYLHVFNSRHGVAYNWDLVLNGIMNCINGLFGLPWLVATTVPCIIHVSAMAEKDETDLVKYTQETRLTGLLAHLLLGLVMLFLNVLKLLPMPVLYGVFLFMGLASLDGIQLWDRLMLLLQEPSKYASYPYVRYMTKSWIHLYTVLQVFFFGLIFFVQNFDPIKIAFPLMTFLCIPACLFFLPKFFDGWELLLLDGEDAEIEEWMELKEASKIYDAEKDSTSSMNEEVKRIKIVDIDDIL